MMIINRIIFKRCSKETYTPKILKQYWIAQNLGKNMENTLEGGTFPPNSQASTKFCWSFKTIQLLEV